MLSATVEVLPLDWMDPVSREEEVDVVVVSDCIYYAEAVQPLGIDHRLNSVFTIQPLGIDLGILQLNTFFR